MSSKEVSRPAMDMEDEEEITSGQVHSSELSAKEKKRKQDKERKEKESVNKKAKEAHTLSHVITKRTKSPSRKGVDVSTSRSTSLGADTSGLIFKARNSDIKLKMSVATPAFSWYVCRPKDSKRGEGSSPCDRPTS